MWAPVRGALQRTVAQALAPLAEPEFPIDCIVDYAFGTVASLVCAAFCCPELASLRFVADAPEWRVVSGSGDRHVRVWYPSNTVARKKWVEGEQLRVKLLENGEEEEPPSELECELTLAGHFEEILSVTALSDGRLVSAGSDESIRVMSGGSRALSDSESESGGGRRSGAHCQLTLSTAAEVYAVLPLPGMQRA
jgi:hypothetical protein